MYRLTRLDCRDANTSIRVILPSHMRIEYPTLVTYKPASSTLFARAYLILHLLFLLAAILRTIPVGKRKV